MNARRSLPLVLTTIAALGLAACGSSSGNDPFNSTSSSAGGGGTSGSGAPKIVVGSANFPESELLMDIYAQALQAKGLTVSTKPNIGSRQLYLKAFDAGDITLLPEYNGALLGYLLGKSGIPKGVSTTEQIQAELAKVVKSDAKVLTPSSAEDKDSVTVTKETADKYKLTTISSLKPVANQLTFGAGAEWSANYQGKVGLKEVYGIEFKSFKPLDSGGPLTIAALKKGDVQAANLFTTDPSIVSNGFVSLEDDQHLYTAQNVVPYIKASAATPEVTAALDAVSKALTTENLTAAVAKVVADKQDPATVAKDFLKANNLG
jgi:osmoprotectant transport system substrate-binding protein